MPRGPLVAIGSNRRYRLTGAAAFASVFRDGRRFDAQHVQLLVTAAAGPVGRVGFVIGKQHLPRAVDRNYVRRTLREAVRRRLREMKRFDIVLRVRGRCERASLSALGQEAAELLDAFLLHKPR